MKIKDDAAMCGVDSNVPEVDELLSQTREGPDEQATQQREIRQVVLERRSQRIKILMIIWLPRLPTVGCCLVG